MVAERELVLIRKEETPAFPCAPRGSPQRAWSQDCVHTGRQILNEKKTEMLAEDICGKTTCTIQRIRGLSILLIATNMIVHSSYLEME